MTILKTIHDELKSTTINIEARCTICNDPASSDRMLPRKIGMLYVGSLQSPFAQIRITKELKALNNKIIECTFDNNQWVFMRERTDKSYPNGYETAKCELVVCMVWLEMVGLRWVVYGIRLGL